MTIRHRLVLHLLALVVAVGVASGTASAQRGEPRVRELTQQAMDAYTNLDLDQARRLLEQALDEARRRNVRGRTLAIVHLDLGVIAIGGANDVDAGVAHFEEALRADPTIELDPMVSNPDMERAFRRARERVTGASPAVEAPAEPAVRFLPHVPASEQLVRTPLPVYLGIPEDVGARQVIVRYRAASATSYREIAMDRVSDGYGVEIPCDAVAEPGVSYYVVAFGENGQVVAQAGSEEAPLSVVVVTERTGEAPALPTRSPPEQCSVECAAGERCGPTEDAQEGEACETDADCGDGLVCEARVCTADPFAPTGEQPRFFFHIGYALGSGVARQGGIADRAPPFHPGERPADWNPGLNGPFAPPGYDTEAEWLQDMVIQYAGYTENPNRAPYALPAPVTVDGTTITEGPIYPDAACDAGPGEYCVRLQDEGLIFVSGFDLELGYWIAPRFAVSVGTRIALRAGMGTLSRMLISVRALYQITAPKPDGLNLSAFVGTGLGQIQLPVPQGGSVPDPTPQGADATIEIDEPFITTGLGNVNLGVLLGYRFVETFGLYARPTLHLLYPDPTLVLEGTLGVEVTF